MFTAGEDGAATGAAGEDGVVARAAREDGATASEYSVGVGVAGEHGAAEGSETCIDPVTAQISVAETLHPSIWCSRRKAQLAPVTKLWRCNSESAASWRLEGDERSMAV